ncbi:MAG TPA: NADPH:quinone reductase [Pseudolabrys sp.]|nr:NADPH:quinone reductase [Pseudolabrys sp.]
MLAAFYEKNGPARDVLRVGEVETTAPGPGEVRVKLATSAVNPSDVKSRLGTTRQIAYQRVIPHSDGAGLIDTVGEGVPRSRIGERVWVWNGQWKRSFGTAAHYITLPSVQAVRLPDRVSFAEGACLGIPAMTAIHAIEMANPDKETILLISGGAGSVSQYAIQFAKMRGARVLTTISSPEKAKVARDLGADHTIDYKRENVGDRVMEITGKRGVDAVIEMDLAANAKLIHSVLRPKGSVIVYGTGGAEVTLPAQFCLVNGIAVRFFIVYELDAVERKRAVSGVTRALDTGALANNTEPPFPLASIAAAHEAVEQGRGTGNIIVTM